eukprot:392074_1
MNSSLKKQKHYIITTMTSSKKRPFSEYTAGDFYLCADCDSVYHGQQELCEHLAKHSNLRRQARKRICVRKKQRKDSFDYSGKPQQLIPNNLTKETIFNNNGINVNKLSGIEQLTQTKKMNDNYYTYFQLKMAINTIINTRRKSSHSMKTSLDIIHDINILKHKSNNLNLQCKNNNLFNRIQSKLLGPNFKQPPMKIHEKIVKTVKKKKKLKGNDKQEMDEENKDNNNNNNNNNNEEEYDIIQQEEKIKFEFDSSDFQRYLDANSEIIGRLQAIRKEKSFYGVTKEEIDLNRQFAENTAAIVKYSSLPQRLLI